MKWISVLALAALVACGNLVQSNPVLSVAQGMAQGGNVDSGPVNVAGAITRDFIEAQPNDLMLASIISRETNAVLVRGGNNGSRLTWLSQDGIGVTFDRGVLVASRGLGFDLMGADVSGTDLAFSNLGNYQRKHSYLTGLDQIRSVYFTCTMALDRQETITIYERNFNTNVYEEFCEGDGIRFRNLYWRDGNGVVWQSRQWISADAGYIGYQRL